MNTGHWTVGVGCVHWTLDSGSGLYILDTGLWDWAKNGYGAHPDFLVFFLSLSLSISLPLTFNGYGY